MKLPKNKSKAKQHPEAKLLMFENFIFVLHQCYHPKVIGHILKNVQKSKCFCFNEVILLIMQTEMKKRSHRKQKQS